MATATFNEVDLYYEVHGQGKPLVLIAGYTCDYTFWSAMLPALERHFEIVIFDNRGIGRTKDNGGSFSIEDMAADTAALVRHLGLSRPAILGQSMGGAIAQTMLANFPEACGHCVILNSTQAFNSVAQMALRSLLALRQANVDFDLMVDASLPWLSGSTWLRTPQNIAEFKAALRENPMPQSVADQARQLAALAPFDSREWTKRWVYPTLVVSAVDDLLAPAREGALLAESLGAKFHEIHGGHASPVEQPEALSQILVDFLAH
jgi:3-oxoadipate enol-lactonase